MTRPRSIACALAALAAAGGAGAPGAHADPFADRVLAYTPAPGQFVNAPSPFTMRIFNDPDAALGAPVGGGTAAPDNSKLVTLGGFGGSITLAFDDTVLDDPCNPLGLDAIVFGNAFYDAGSPAQPVGEPGLIEISLDANANGLPDDPWYLVPGPDVGPVPNDQLASQDWDNDPTTPTPPADTAHYPSDALYTHIPPGFPSAYTTTTFLLPLSAIDDPGALAYADRSPTLLLGDLDGDDLVDDPGADPAVFYATPDNPFAIGVDPGAGGGDAFDIAWAVDPATGRRVNLRGFDFIRLTSGVDGAQGVFGEVSCEIGAVADARADPLRFDVDASGAVDVEDLYAWHAAPSDLSGEGDADADDAALLARCVRAGETADMEATR
jgi:hypothetical protein